MTQPVSFTPSLTEVRKTLTPAQVPPARPEGFGVSLSAKGERAAEELERRLAEASPGAEPLALPTSDDESPAEAEPLVDVPPLPTRTGTPWLDDPKLRKAIEARLDPLDFDELVSTGKVRQRVPIVPGKLEPMFQTLSGEDEAFVTEQAHLEAAGTPNLLRIYTLMELAMGLQVSLDGRPLPKIFDDKGVRDAALFRIRWKKVADSAVEIPQLLALNFVWFRERVGRLTVLDALGNG